MDPAVELRLKKGAMLIGNFWRAGQRCAMGWSVKVGDFPDGVDPYKAMESWACQCEKKTDFCKAKSHWFKLAMMELRDVIEDEYSIPFMMTAEEWDLTKLTMTIPLKDMGNVQIGPAGIVIMTDLWKAMEAPEGLKSTLRVLQKFPGSRVQGVQEPDAVETDGPVAAVETGPSAAEDVA
jgi:hypothetical protein